MSRRVPGWISAHPALAGTLLASEFLREPLGFVDVGAAGGPHPLVEPLAPWTSVLCFEPDPASCEEIRRRWARPDPFAKVSVIQTALADRKDKATLFVSVTPSNTSLLAPDSKRFVERYQAKRFELAGTTTVETDTLDAVLAAESATAEFLKLDTQGTEYEILLGAERALERTAGVWCEVEFFQVYEGQKTFSDVDRLLRERGLVLYGLYPHFRSAKRIERRGHASEERLMWADALFLRDPLDSFNAGRSFDDRSLRALFAIAAATGFHELALEIAALLHAEGVERTALERFVDEASAVDRAALAAGVEKLHQDVRRIPDAVHVLVRKFVDRNFACASADWIPDP